MGNLPVESIQLGVVVALAFGAVELSKLGISAVRDAYNKTNGVETSRGKIVCPLSNGQTKAMIEWLRTINTSLQPLGGLAADVSVLKDRQQETKIVLDRVKAETGWLKARQEK